LIPLDGRGNGVDIEASLNRFAARPRAEANML